MLQSASLVVLLQLAVVTSGMTHDNEVEGMFAGAPPEIPGSGVLSEFGQGIVENDYSQGRVSMIEAPAGSLIHYKAIYHDEVGDYKNATAGAADGNHTVTANYTGSANHTVVARWEAGKKFYAWCAANAPWGAFNVAWKAWKGSRTDIRNAAKGCLEGMRQVAESNCGLSRVIVGSGDCVCGYILGDKIDAV